MCGCVCVCVSRVGCVSGAYVRAGVRELCARTNYGATALRRDACTCLQCNCTLQGSRPCETWLETAVYLLVDHFCARKIASLSALIRPGSTLIVETRASTLVATAHDM